MNLTHLVWDIPLKQLLSAQRSWGQSCQLHATQLSKPTTEKRKKKKMKQLPAVFTACLKGQAPCPSLCMCDRKMGGARKSDWNETICPLCQIRLEHSCHFTLSSLYYLEDLRKAIQCSCRHCMWRMQSLWCELNLNQANDWIPQCLYMWMLRACLPLFLTRLGIFIILS